MTAETKQTECLHVLCCDYRKVFQSSIENNTIVSNRKEEEGWKKTRGGKGEEEHKEEEIGGREEWDRKEGKKLTIAHKI